MGLGYQAGLGLGYQENRTTFTEIPKGDFLMVSSSGSHICAIDMDLHLLSCGHNEYGQLGLGHQENKASLTLGNPNVPEGHS